MTLIAAVAAFVTGKKRAGLGHLVTCIQATTAWEEVSPAKVMG
jgi:hypothetical protein